MTADDMRRLKPIRDVDPGMIEAVEHYRRRGRPPVETPKTRISLRLSADLVDGIRSSGPGYNARVEKVLRKALAEGEV
ncbi:BrnA antitoxin family protein [Marinivivus vitaminiproducens]|uniref:BrnA antitoxin family protein n=1 Tax=Marinivivus vitaminiproducens TaxID=3035935 RepID=UPI0027AAB713|nr:BrnA antitoxin family protein [Geminicoccaceae bacterium SCSIO 64248]